MRTLAQAKVRPDRFLIWVLVLVLVGLIGLGIFVVTDIYSQVQAFAKAIETAVRPLVKLVEGLADTLQVLYELTVVTGAHVGQVLGMLVGGSAGGGAGMMLGQAVGAEVGGEIGAASPWILQRLTSPQDDEAREIDEREAR